MWESVIVHSSFAIILMGKRDMCSDSLASLTRSPVSSAGRASDLQAEGRGFESYTG